MTSFATTKRFFRCFEYDSQYETVPLLDEDIKYLNAINNVYKNHGLLSLLLSLFSGLLIYVFNYRLATFPFIRFILIAYFICAPFLYFLGTFAFKKKFLKDITENKKYLIKGELESKGINKHNKKSFFYFIIKYPLPMTDEGNQGKYEKKYEKYFNEFNPGDKLKIYLSASSYQVLNIEKVE
jgi:hypothetical protein